MCRRIKAMTADSFKPNCASIASNAVRSSQAITTVREILDSQIAKGLMARPPTLEFFTELRSMPRPSSEVVKVECARTPHRPLALL